MKKEPNRIQGKQWAVWTDRREAEKKRKKQHEQERELTLATVLADAGNVLSGHLHSKTHMQQTGRPRACKYSAIWHQVSCQTQHICGCAERQNEMRACICLRQIPHPHSMSPNRTTTEGGHKRSDTSTIIVHRQKT